MNIVKLGTMLENIDIDKYIFKIIKKITFDQ